MLFSMTTNGDSATLKIEGELDALATAELRPTIHQVSKNRPRKVVVDLSRLRLIDSSGVGAMVALSKVVRSYGGTLSVAGVRDQPLAIFRLLHLDRVLIRDPG